MTLDAAACWRALAARDARFDGRFFVGVETTGVYCRPVCRAKTPRADRCRFFRTGAEAERAGFRACFRCRPELAPGLAPMDGPSRLVAAAVVRIDAGALDEIALEGLAADLGVSGRHLRRAFDRVIGVSPLELWQSRRLARAKALLQDTRLPMAEIAHASGFRSLRRFNAAVQERLGVAPRVLRGARGTKAAAQLVLRLDYRGPIDLEHLLGYLARRAVPGVERCAGGVWERVVRIGGHEGEVTVRADPGRDALIAEASVALAPVTASLACRLRALFDLDADPAAVRETLERDRMLRARVRARPGMRVPGAFDPFELAVRAVLGQQVSVAAATTLAGRLAARFAGRIEAEPLAAASVAEIASIGLPAQRARTISGLARAVADGHVRLDGAATVEETMAALDALPGIGPWTASYVAMRALRCPDAFPAGDLGVRKALGGISEARAIARAEAWRPWRAYAVMHLWNGAG